ncbi:GNAT family N-acetyltransferase [Wenxinia marina]|uniref:Sortase n=1 Tax=Wenxinia marina DSM 24838 TaxID=1123501 RepID=A0A0D0QCL7_9RHOB|nr:GNAT family N-acetyltransferase [Wenxinia marina]KIQ68673.1 Sortase [Wenxinia marina DSM 24838]GGL67833.1 N-acetyltransferase [Wenxinia marina]
MIRPATPADAAAIAAIWNHYIRETTVTFLPDEKTDADIRATLAADRGLFVHEGPDGVDGFARYFQFRGGAGYRHTCEHTVLLAPGTGGQGAGRALMAAVEDHARAGGVHALFAGVSAENPGAVAFHARIGFAEVARLPEVGRKFGRWIDLVLMQKFL